MLRNKQHARKDCRLITAAEPESAEDNDLGTTRYNLLPDVPGSDVHSPDVPSIAESIDLHCFLHDPVYRRRMSQILAEASYPELTGDDLTDLSSLPDRRSRLH